MALYKTYIIDAAQKALAEELESIQLEPAEPGSPAVAPADEPVFTTDIEERLLEYREKALLVQNFEGFQQLLEIVATELSLSPVTDLDKIASVFNRYRVEKGLDPL